jgi:acyl-CoA thioesterase I
MKRLLSLVTLVLLLVFPALAQPRTVVCFGDSLTAGYGLDPAEAWPALLEERLNERDGAGSWRVVNAGLSGETTSGGSRRLSWILRGQVDVFILALGANDGLRGQPVEAMEQNLDSMLKRVRERYPQAQLVVAGMQMPFNLGPDYTSAFAAAFPKVAERHGAKLIPFLLEGVATRPELNLPDQIHPNPAGQRVVLENVLRHAFGT